MEGHLKRLTGAISKKYEKRYAIVSPGVFVSKTSQATEKVLQQIPLLCVVARGAVSECQCFLRPRAMAFGQYCDPDTYLVFA
jgi:hypothetical protein